MRDKTKSVRITEANYKELRKLSRIGGQTIAWLLNKAVALYVKGGNDVQQLQR